MMLLKDYKAIVAYDSKRGIGKDLEIPWYIPEDLKRFKQLTLAQTVIMGRKTFDSIIARLGKPLPKRKTIIISNSLKNTSFENCFIYSDIQKVINDIDSAWIAGGGEIYNLFLPYTSQIYATEVEGDFNCNIFFPQLSEKEWKVDSVEKKEGFQYLIFNHQ